MNTLTNYCIDGYYFCLCKKRTIINNSCYPLGTLLKSVYNDIDVISLISSEVSSLSIKIPNISIIWLSSLLVPFNV